MDSPAVSNFRSENENLASALTVQNGGSVKQSGSASDKSSYDDSPAWDADTDGLGLFDEYRYCTDPFNPDTDGDGVRDGDEVPHSPGSDHLDTCSAITCLALQRPSYYGKVTR